MITKNGYKAYHYMSNKALDTWTNNNTDKIIIDTITGNFYLNLMICEVKLKTNMRTIESVGIKQVVPLNEGERIINTKPII